MIDTATQTKVEELVSSYQRTLAAVRANDKLSAQGKRDSIARMHRDVTTKVTQVRDGLQKTTTTRRADLERTLFGVADQGDKTAASVSLRDAGARVDAIKPGDEVAVSALLTRALRTGDEMLARACLQRGWDDGSNLVVNQYLDARPERTRMVEQLVDLKVTAEGGAGAGWLGDLGYIVPTPSELQQYLPHQIEQIATGEDEVPMPDVFHVYGSHPEAVR